MTDRQNLLPDALDGLERIVATSSRDWGEYRVDAWLYGVLVGWDCEEDHEHDDTCGDGAAMDEMAAKHGWDAATVAKLRRYRAAVRVALEHRAEGCTCGAPVGDDVDDAEARRTWQHSRSCPMGG